MAWSMRGAPIGCAGHFRLEVGQSQSAKCLTGIADCNQQGRTGPHVGKGYQVDLPRATTRAATHQGAHSLDLAKWLSERTPELTRLEPPLAAAFN